MCRTCKENGTKRVSTCLTKCLCVGRKVERGDVEGDGTKERKPTPKVRDDLLLQLAEKKRQQIAALRAKRIENEKEEKEKEAKKRLNSHLMSVCQCAY